MQQSAGESAGSHSFVGSTVPSSFVDATTPTSFATASSGESAPIDVTDAKQPSLKRAFFDFDQTISRCHVFKQLAGWERSAVSPPFALTDRGQFCKIVSLNKEGRCWTYSEVKQDVVAAARVLDGANWVSSM